VHIFLSCEPLTEKRMIKITERKNRRDRAYFQEEIAVQQENADKNEPKSTCETKRKYRNVDCIKRRCKFGKQLPNNRF
jgi:hypothetical protein